MNDDAWDDEKDGGQGDEDTTIPCPYCKHPIYEDSQRCPHCGNYISEEDVPARRKPWWILVGVLIVLYVVYRWIVG